MAKTLNDFVNEALRVIDEISNKEAVRILEQPDREGWTFVDVREGEEFAKGHVPGARNKRDPWFADRDRKMILYCGGGNRSALAARTLMEMGFTRTVSMAGGWKDWSSRNLPVET
jgi:rhodanese-related sulfurtransferase